jgi:aminoglycoside 6'-N-acetyltransferase
VQPTLTTARTRLRPLTAEDAEVLRAIRASPEVARWWHPADDGWPISDKDVEDPGEARWAVEIEGVVKGFVQTYDQPDPDYRYANIDLFLDASVQGHGIGREVVAAALAYCIDAGGHHRVVIDPAAANVAAIACYSAVGFRPVGVMRDYERDAQGTGWHDGLLMEWVAGVDGPTRP